MAATKLRRPLSGALGLTLVTVGIFAACNHVGDQYCEVGANLQDPTEDCPFGPPGGPGSHSDGCQGVTVNTTAAGCNTTALTWAGPDGIWYSQLRTSCSANGVCHAAGAGGITLPYDKATDAFNALAGYNKQGLGKYIDPVDPSRTWILCNLEKLPTGGGDPMPPSSSPPVPMDALTKIKAWAECGEKLGTDMGGGGPPPPPMDAGSD